MGLSLTTPGGDSSKAQPNPNRSLGHRALDLWFDVFFESHCLCFVREPEPNALGYATNLPRSYAQRKS